MQVMMNESKKVSVSQVSSENTYSHVAGKQRNVSTSYNAMDIFEYRTDSDANLLGCKPIQDQGTTMEEIQSFASVFDVGTYQDKMTIMSNSVSEEDLGKMYEEGFEASSTDIDEYVTVMDQIKLTEAKAGKIIAGYNDELSQSMIAEACGNASVAAVIKNELDKAGLYDSKELEKKIAQTVSQTAELEAPDDAVKKYMIENGMEPTIENLFTGQFSGSIAGKQAESYYTKDCGYLQMVAGNADRGFYEKEAEQILRKNGIEPTKEAIENAKWMMSEGIPVSQKTMELAEKIDNIKIPETKEELIAKIVRAISEGADPEKTNLSASDKTSLEQLIDYGNRLDEISTKAVDEVIDQRLPFTLQSLEYCEMILFAKNQNEKSYENTAEKGESNLLGNQTVAERVKQQGIDTVAAYRKLEEFRLRMTTRAGLTLIKAGVSIDTTEISKLVDSLKEIEKASAKAMFPKENEEEALRLKKEFDDTTKVLKELPKMPLSMIGAALTEKTEVTLEDYYEEGKQSRIRLEQAKESYETYMTVIRADLGDNIENAFSNVPQMLQEAELDVTDANIRAAKILGYNHLEITEESLEAVKEADEKLQYILNELNPALTLKLIRDGENPMKLSIDTLIEKIEDYQESPETEHVRFSKFLHGLDQKKAISKDEREAFLEVYRVLKQVEKTKGAPIGALLSTDAEWNLENLKQASNASKKTIDYRFADDSVEKSKFSRDIKSVSYKISATALEKVLSEKKNLSAVTLNELKQAINETDLSEEEKAMGRQMQDILRDASKAGEYTVQKLMELDLEVNADLIIAMEGIKENRGEMYRIFDQMLRANKSSKEVDAEQEDLSAVFLEEIEDFPESFMAESTLEETYEKFLTNMQDSIMESIENADGYIDLRQMMILNKQVGILRSMEKEKEYEIPMKIRGELTSVHVALRAKEEQKGNVTVTTMLPNGNKLGADFTLKDRRVSGFIACDSKEEIENLQEIQTRMSQILEKQDMDCSGIKAVYSSDCHINRMDEQTSKNQEATNNELYQVARAFLLSL